MSDENKENQNNTIGDQPTSEDALGFTPYVIAIAEFLTNPETKPPLTLSIEGEWGSGKSSFMKQLEEEIKRKSDELDQEELKEIWHQIKKQHIFSNLSDLGKFLQLKLGLKQKTQTVWFNAWRHDKAESLWATFALSFLEQLAQNRDFIDFFANSWSHLKLISHRFNWKDKPFQFVQTLAISSLIISAIIAIPIVYLKVGFEGVSQWSEKIVNLISEESKEQNNQSEEENDNSLLNIVLIIGGTGGSVAGIGKLIVKLRDLIGDPKLDLTQYIESPDYDNQVSFIEKFHDDFSKIVNAYAGENEKVYVFIDDLDRCELGKSADLLQALNMMIANDPNLIFILGMDREKVAAGITYKQKDILPYLDSVSSKNGDILEDNKRLMKQMDYGFRFMEKFVQLSFTVPKPSHHQLDVFLEQLSSPQTQFHPSKSFLGIPIVLFEKGKTMIGDLVNYVIIKLVIKENSIFLKQSFEHQFWLSFLVYQKLLKPELLLRKLEITNSENKQYFDLAIYPIIDKDLSPENLKNIVKMVAPFLNYNTRSLKQFINKLKLEIYIAYYSIGVTWEESKNNLLTIEQLSKFIAIILKYPRLRIKLEEHNQLLTYLEDYALHKKISPEIAKVNSNDVQKFIKDWIDNYQDLSKFLTYGKYTDNGNRYSLNNKNLTKLLQISSELELHPRYFKLRGYLANKQWQEADEETYKVIKQIGSKNPKSWLNEDDIENFPCEDLRIINDLWLQYSDGKFGFTVQRDIWLACSTIGKNQDEAFGKFLETVRWKPGDYWYEPYRNEYRFVLSDNLLMGYLPKNIYLMGDFWDVKHFFLAWISRTKACKM